MTNQTCGWFVVALGVAGAAGCAVNGKQLFGFGGTSSSSSPGQHVSAEGGDPTPGIPTGPAPASFAWCKDVPKDRADVTNALAD
ncbi:MAG: hypothetical protein WKG01_41075, partial [Kofleriaceae bacterium]